MSVVRAVVALALSYSGIALVFALGQAMLNRDFRAAAMIARTRALRRARRWSRRRASAKSWRSGSAGRSERPSAAK